jgi:hypothetical protein
MPPTMAKTGALQTISDTYSNAPIIMSLPTQRTKTMRKKAVL